MHWLPKRILGYVKPTDRVLDLGAGVRWVWNGARIGGERVTVDACEMYAPDILGVLPGVLEDERIAGRRWDVILLLDILEHMEREDGVRVLDWATAHGARDVFAWTPDGWRPNDLPDGAWGLPDNEWQRHRSAFTTEDFRARGYATERHMLKRGAKGEATHAVLAWLHR